MISVFKWTVTQDQRFYKNKDTISVFLAAGREGTINFAMSFSSVTVANILYVVLLGLQLEYDTLCRKSDRSTVVIIQSHLSHFFVPGGCTTLGTGFSFLALYCYIGDPDMIVGPFTWCEYNQMRIIL
jgi:hypothetical protein